MRRHKLSSFYEIASLLRYAVAMCWHRLASAYRAEVFHNASRGVSETQFPNHFIVEKNFTRFLFHSLWRF